MNHSAGMNQRGLARKSHAHFWTLHSALINWQCLIAVSIGHAPWKNDRFQRKSRQTQACIIDELGENHLGLVTNPRLKSVLLKVYQALWLWFVSLWDKVNFPWGKGFSYGTGLQLRKPVVSPWFCFRHFGWSQTRHVEKVFYVCWAGAPFLKTPIWVECQNPRETIQWADWHGPPLPSVRLIDSPVVVPTVWGSNRTGAKPARKEGGRFVVTDLK